MRFASIPGTGKLRKSSSFTSRIYWKQVSGFSSLYQIMLLKCIFDCLNNILLAFCTQEWTSSIFVLKMQIEPNDFKYFLRVPDVLYASPRTQLKQTRLQRRVRHPEIYSCMYTHYTCVHTHKAVTKNFFVGFPTFRFYTAGLYPNLDLTLLF